jgi:gliding motility-associated protein GldM
MAGGKETPRQKMIGMMYLVLTALLALQVSSAIMQKFMFLDNSLVNVKNKSIEENTGLVTKIGEAVAAEGNKDKAITEKAADVRRETAKIIDYMEAIRKDMIEVTGGYDDDGINYKGGKEEEKIAGMMVGTEGKKSGKAYELKKMLNDYETYLKGMGVAVPNLAMSGSEDPGASKDKDQKRKDFAQLNFSETPMVAALAVLSQKQTEVLKYENEALNVLAAKVGASDLKFDNVRAMVRPESKYVAAGTKYEAEMFLTASSSAITPTMTARGAALKVDEASKMGKVTFTAQASSYDNEGLSKQTWDGKINFKFKGQDTAFTIKETFFVVKPVIQVQSASVSALYRNCGNELSIQVPALGSTYNPDFKVTNGAVYKNPSKKGYITIVPNASAREVVISVSSNGNAIGTEKFAVRGIPRPTIEARIGTRPANEKQGEAAPGPRSLTMAAIAEDGFKSFLPKDSDYRVTEWECILVRGKRPVNTQKVSGPTANLTAFASVAQPGDRILIDVKKVVRKNYKGDVETVDVGMVIKNIPLN